MSRARLNELYNIISEAQDEIHQIKDDCKHDEGFFVENYGDARAFTLQRLCNICNSPVGDPTNDEVARYHRMQKKEQSEYLKGQGYSKEEIANIMDH